MFFCRGMTAVISRDTISITNPFYVSIASERVSIFGAGFISIGAIVALLTLILAAIVLGYTKFGRTVFAIGGNEASASLMGLPVFRTKVMVYTISGFCSALGGVAYSLIMLTGYNLHGLGMEMDAIASSRFLITIFTSRWYFISAPAPSVTLMVVVGA